MAIHNLLQDPLIRFETRDGVEHGSLPEVYAALMVDRVESFPALRAHQQPAWHMFLAQLGAIAAHRAGLSAPPEDAATWLEIIGRLTRADFPSDEPWCLVVDDRTKPAFLQPPVPDGVDLDKRTATPDALDMLITSRNHDLKQSVASRAGYDDWVFALVSLQTMEGYGGGGGRLNGIARMNKGSSSRVLMGLAPILGANADITLRPGPWLKRDIVQLLARRDDLLRRVPIGYAAIGGLALTWIAPWRDGDQLSLDLMDVWFVEICRRVRLQREEETILALTGNSSTERTKAKHLNGFVGDPWGPIHRIEAKALSITEHGRFHYERVVELLLSGDWHLPLLAEMSEDEAAEVANWLLVLAAIARGNSKTGGFRSRVLPLKGRVARGLGPQRKALHELAKQQIEEIEKIDTVLRKSLVLGVAGGDRDKIKKESFSHTQPYRDRLDAVADRAFFPALWKRFEAEQAGTTAEVEAARRAFLLPLIDTARHLLDEGLSDIPCPSILRPRAEARARRRFEVLLRSENTGFSALLANSLDDARPDDQLEASDAP